MVVLMTTTGTWAQLVCLQFVLLFLNFLPLCTREADDTKEQIEKKCQALNTADPGSDLFSVQALQRQHENFERDLVPLGEKVRCAFKPFQHIPLHIYPY